MQQWLLRAVVRRLPVPEMVGHADFQARRCNARTVSRSSSSLAQAIFPASRGPGYGTEAARALMARGQTTHGVCHFVASVASENQPSLAVVPNLAVVQQWR